MMGCDYLEKHILCLLMKYKYNFVWNSSINTMLNFYGRVNRLSAASVVLLYLIHTLSLNLVEGLKDLYKRFALH